MHDPTRPNLRCAAHLRRWNSPEDQYLTPLSDRARCVTLDISAGELILAFRRQKPSRQTGESELKSFCLPARPPEHVRRTE